MQSTDPKIEREHELLLRKMYAESNDEIKILNPTDKDYEIQYDKRFWVVPKATNGKGGKKSGETIVPRYIAMHYLKHHINNLITKESEDKMKPFFDKYQEKGDMAGYHAFEERTALRTSDETLRAKYRKQLWGGVIRKFGLDDRPSEEATRPRDSRHSDYAGVEDLETNKQNFIEEVSE